ncbi:MAG: inositol monophosphatase [Thiomicrospira sp.]|uniref:inositol monophosphatase family protein n=1 Tax=Thiomicrospira sp. TaxID=935 RepID=UPI0019F11182|nr:inositol monophosphatase [Thiomicrospira sp.]MBE0493561.1 inositol monophosphatase [Thiomicrospira sp.]
MSQPFSDHQAWSKLKQAIVALAQQEVMRRFNQVGYEIKNDGSLLTEADTSMQQQVADYLKNTWPEFALLGEESSLETQQAALEHPTGCWVLDPVDGTTNFANHIPFFSVSLALVIGGKPVLGLVYDPARDELFSARLGLGAELNDQPLKAPTITPDLKHCVGIIDFKRLAPALATALATQAPYASQRSFGSVALDWCWIAAGRGQVYLHGNQSLWDYAAGWLILEETGGASSNLEGETVFQNKIGKRSAVAAINSTTFCLWHAWIQQHN